MTGIKFNGKLKHFLRAPIYLTIFFLIGSIGLFFIDLRAGAGAFGISVLYGLLCFVFYRLYRKKINNEIISFATQFGMVQRELLRNFQIPYAILDDEGKILWMNNQFVKVSGRDKAYQKSITGIFTTITRQVIEQANDEPYSIHLEHNERFYEAALQKLSFSQDGGEQLLALSGEESLTALLLFDETDLMHYRKINDDERLVVALVYIDNYEETIDEVEDVKRSLLTAVIDRKISRFFSDINAIVRKVEKDKYFIVFQQQYMAQLEEGKFSLLEDIKTTKMGNESEITLSIGIGMNGADYTESAEFAKTAIGLALGRGGSQAVVKNRGEVMYYGVRGKEIEKNTRVKARVKAQALREMMETKNRVIVMGHQISDVDALGAGLGVFCAARELGKPCQIVLNTITTSLRPLVEAFSESAGYPRDMFVNSGEALDILDNNTLVVVVDTNRPNYTECPQLLERCKNIVVFDHHRQGSEQVQNPMMSYIEPYASSTCEMIAEVLQYFSERVHLSPLEADCIYAGILIDTNNFMTKVGVRTFEAAAYLRRCGAEVTRVRKMLREDMETYKARAEVVRHAEVYHGAFAISVCEASELESPTVVGAQAANELLNIVGIKASFVLTEYQKKIYVSSRSIDEIDVQLIMERLGGGGHLNVAGAQIEDSNIDDVKNRIENILDIMIDEGEIKL
ncbi:c-di-AMP phosphodiesterase, consists of a GGDEF-like and DHH domains [Lachnospiraceae bacterium XBD2001]|jgi:c-di-AMP phosphodiesterase-like protein|nr:c-di-AMP phosphodiesterase, consists of a GGDEF-like and DHH domains [Lachnospiraceae bacterium XBD2001]